MERCTKPEFDFETTNLAEELTDSMGTALNRLAQYEDAEEQGLLARLPCKAGDAITATVLRPYNGHSAKIQGEVSDVQIVVRVVYDGGRHIDFLSDDFGKTLFLTKDETGKLLEEANRNE